MDHPWRLSAAPWLWFTLPLTVFLLLAAGAGVFDSDLYHQDAPKLAAQLIGADYFGLAIVLPLLIGSALLARRGGLPALMVWLGTLFYLVYTYLVFAFHVSFNSFFLVYLALLGLSIYGLILTLTHLDIKAIGESLPSRVPARPVSLALALVPLAFYAIALSELIPAIANDEIPKNAQDFGLPTDFTHVIDMAIFLPAMGLGAFYLGQRKPIGYLLAGGLLTMLVEMMFALLAMFLSMEQHDHTVPTEDYLIIGAFAAIFLGILAWYLRSLSPDSAG